MSVSSSPMFPALSVVSLLLAGSALYFAQQQPEPVPVQTPASFDSSGMEESISALRQEVMGLQSKLDLMGKTVSEKPGTPTSPKAKKCGSSYAREKPSASPQPSKRRWRNVVSNWRRLLNVAPREMKSVAA